MATYIDQRDAAITAIQALIAPNGVGAITGQVHQDNEVGQTEDAYLNLFAYDNFGFVIVRTGIDPATGNEVNTAAQNGANLIAAYAAASALTPNGQPLSATNRAAVLVPPGVYSFGAGKMTMNTEFVDIIGMGAPEDVVITSQYAVNDGTGTITKTCDNAIIKNVTISNGAPWTGAYVFTDASGFAPQGAYANEVLDNVLFYSLIGANPYMRIDQEYAGTYRNCRAKNANAPGIRFMFFAAATGRFENCYAPTENGFGCTIFNPVSPILGLDTSGSFVDCECYGGFGVYSAGAPAPGNVTGYFKSCKAQIASFGPGATNITGSFYDCTAGNFSFSCLTLHNGVFYNCVGGNDSFNGVTNQSYYFGCKAGNDSFNGKNISYVAEKCTAGDNSFGYSSTNITPVTFADANLYHCKAGSLSFGVRCSMDANTEFHYCAGGNQCFGFGDGGAGQYISAKFYNCTARGLSFATGVQGPRTSGAGLAIDAEFYNCVGGSQCFGAGIDAGSGGSGGGIELSGILSNCTAGGWSFGTSQSNALNQWAEASGRFFNCVGGDNCFGASSGSNGGAVASGEFYNCRAGTGSFGSNSAAGITTSYASGYFVDCSGGSFSFAGHTGAYKNGKLIRCVLQGDNGTGIAANDTGPLVENGLMEDCTWVISGPSEPALLVGNLNSPIAPGDEPPKIYGGKYIAGSGATRGIQMVNISTATPDASIVQIRINVAIDPTINNLASAGALTAEGNYVYSGL